MYIHRKIESKLKEYLGYFPVIGLTGPRQSGKSTMLNKILSVYQYVSFDDLQSRRFYYDDPVGFMKKYNNKVIFDEAQKVPELFESIKIAVDNDRQNYGKYIITGSSQFTLTKKITESLAGRIGLLSLLPFQYAELDEKISNNTIWQGSYPELVVRNFKGSEDWYSSYLTTYIEKDVRDLLQIGDLRDFQRLIELLAANTGQLLVYSNLARDLGVSVPTVKRWISVLEASYIIFLLSPYYNNFGKRIIKSPKIYFYDTGLVSYITGISTEQQFEKGPMAGALFENFIIADVYKKIAHNKQNIQIYFYRSSNHQEIDLIIDKKNSFDFIEIKLPATYNVKSIKSLNNIIAKNLGKDDKKYIIYRGDFIEMLDVTFINYQEYLTK